METQLPSHFFELDPSHYGAKRDVLVEFREFTCFKQAVGSHEGCLFF
jgi:hypothetical protein